MSCSVGCRAQNCFPQVSGLWQDEDDRALLLRETDVPVTTYLNLICILFIVYIKNLQVLLRDATTLLLHFSLILPVQIDRVFFTTIVRQVDNNFICVLSCFTVASFQASSV